MPAHPVSIDEQLVFRYQQCQLQALGPALLHAAAGHDPLPAVGIQATALRGVVEQRTQAGAQVRGLDQARCLIIDDQLAAVGVGNGIAFGIEQHDFGMGGHHVLGQGRAEFGQGQVGGHDCLVATASGQRRANVMGGKKDIGFGRDLVIVATGAGKPGTAARVVGVVQVVLATDECQVPVEKQRLGASLAAAVALNAPDLVSRRVRGLDQRFDLRSTQRADHEKVAVVVAQVQRCQIGVVLE
ncbi:hypothetical protein D3C75_412540 [compost metagenome]